jgi:hypothetical protein
MVNQGKLLKWQNIPCIAFFQELTLLSRNWRKKLSKYRNIILSQFWALVKISGTIQTFGEIWELLNFTSGRKGNPQG